MFYFKIRQSSTNISKNSKLLRCYVFIFKSQKAIERSPCRKTTAADCTVHRESKSTSKSYCKQTSQQSYSTMLFWFDYILQCIVYPFVSPLSFISFMSQWSIFTNTDKFCVQRKQNKNLFVDATTQDSQDSGWLQGNTWRNEQYRLECN